jgi:hypothetical protein
MWGALLGYGSTSNQEGIGEFDGVEPYGYLRHVLERIAERPINRVGDLLPWKVTSTNPAQRMCA